MTSRVIFTGKISLGIQFLVGALDAFALTLPRPKAVLLRDMLKVELAVQSVEFMFYVWMVQSWGSYGLENIAQYRYYDWMITTPAMLITLMALLGGSPSQTLRSFVEEHAEFIATILSLNWMMLFFGIAGELKCVSQTRSVVLGFIPFMVYFARIYQKFVHGKNLPAFKVQIFVYFFVVWSLYGLFALFPPISKNVGYNILDLFAKNLFGVVLSIMVFIHEK